MSYHINPESGEPGQCRAQFQCPFGSPSEHYSDPFQARQAYEQSMAAQQVPSALGTRRVSDEIKWRDYDTMRAADSNLNKPDIDFGFNWSDPTSGNSLRVSMAKWMDDSTGTLYAHDTKTNQITILGENLTEAEVDVAWHRVLDRDAARPPLSMLLKELKG